MDYWFGYLMHLVGDCVTELPAGFEVTPANESESPHFEPLLEDIKLRHAQVTAQTQALIANQAHDTRSNRA